MINDTGYPLFSHTITLDEGLKFDNDKARLDLIPPCAAALMRSRRRIRYAEDVLVDMISGGIDYGNYVLWLVEEIEKIYGQNAHYEILGDVFAHGANKYDEWNWRKVDDGEKRYRAAAMRHLASHLEGHHVDDDSGLPHLGHALATLCMLLEFSHGEEEG